MKSRDPATWRVWTDEGGLAWTDPGSDRPALREAITDCAGTLSPIGEPPSLSTYWVERLLNEIECADVGVVAHGNLWVLSRNGTNVEVRMDVDPPDSEPLDVVEVSELIAALSALVEEVRARVAEGHQLANGYWAQRNPP